MKLKEFLKEEKIEETIWDAEERVDVEKEIPKATKKLNVLIACEHSGSMRDSFASLGHNAMSADLIDAETPGEHFKGDVLPMVESGVMPKYGKIDLMIAHPPCFEPGTLIKTDNGYKNIEDVEIGDMVFTHTNTYKRVYDKQKTFSENIMNIKISSSKKTKVTSEHPFYCIVKNSDGSISEPQWIASKDLDKNCYVATPSIKTGDLDEKIMEQFKDLPLDKQDFWWVVGKWVGDGWSLKHHYSYENMICSSYKKEELEVLESKLKSVFNNVSKSKQKTTMRFTIINKLLFDFLNLFGKYCDGKFIPEFVFRLPKDTIKSFLDGYFFADGHKKDNGKIQLFSTVSKKLAFGLQLLILKAYGKPTYFHEVPPRKKEWRIKGRLIKYNTIYTLGFQYFYSRWKPDFIEKDGVVFSKFMNSSLESYNDYVYNLSVEEDESYVANNLVCHNCTYLTNTGNAWFYAPGQKKEPMDIKHIGYPHMGNPTKWRERMYWLLAKQGQYERNKNFPDRLEDRRKGIEFFMKFIESPISKVCVENPAGIMSAIYRQPDQEIHPWMFGHPEKKRTHFWLKGLPPVTPTDVVSEQFRIDFCSKAFLNKKSNFEFNNFDELNKKYLGSTVTVKDDKEFTGNKEWSGREGKVSSFRQLTSQEVEARKHDYVQQDLFPQEMSEALSSNRKFYEQFVAKVVFHNGTHSEFPIHQLMPGQSLGKLRSKTFKGIGLGLAIQWGGDARDL
jgi:intein/homing endonuclease